MTKWVYSFGNGSAEGAASMKALLGGKGANLSEMCNLGLPVPPGFTITTEACHHYYANGRTLPEDLVPQAMEALRAIEAEVGAKFGDAENPLLVSVRSGAPVSMPGMMDTVLNLGLNDETVEGLAARSNDRRFAYDSYRRFIQMYGDVVLGVDNYLFESSLDDIKASRGYRVDTELSADDWLEVIESFKATIVDDLGEPFPQDVEEQLWGAVGAVFGSWNTPRAVTYRDLHDLADDMGTGVNVQAMVFGNMGEDCATGVAFTRNPANGERAYYGEFLINAQGEDVVAGIRTPQPLTAAMRVSNGLDLPSMDETMPDLFGELVQVFDRLEAHYRDMQDIEFTVQGGRLWVLQTRAGKRTAAAALKIAVDMAGEGLITREEALLRIDPASLDQLLHPTLDPDAPRDIIARGLPASPGAVSGRIVLSADQAERRAIAGEPVVLVRVETSPDDIHGMHAAKGILTSRGGMTSHAAVVARGMGKPCVCGAGDVRVDYEAGTVQASGAVLTEEDWITIDGSNGTVMRGEVATVDPQLSGDFSEIMAWADAARRLKVRTNAETAEDVQTALKFGAEGIGLCRTEHMFFGDERIIAMREMILADTEEERRAALAKILPMQRRDFVEIFELMAGLPVTIRLLDPPLHEFLPHDESEIEDVAAAAGVKPDLVRRRTTELREANPMLGLRGCRLGLLFPEVYEMQVRAIFEAVLETQEHTGQPVLPEIMVPLVGYDRELELIRERIDAVAKDIRETKGEELHYLVGTMIEVPRAAVMADKIAAHAAFFSFGTNDLTQMTLGLSRDDSDRFMEAYLRNRVFVADPFQTLDCDGVGALVRMAADKGRGERPDLKLGICGEHGGDPNSVAFCETIGLDYVSCSPYRVPIARLAAAQAVLGERERADV